MTEKTNSKTVLNRGANLRTKNLQKEPYHETTEANPVAQAQKQISSQRTIGVFSPQEQTE